MKRKTKPDIRAITQLKQEAAHKAARASKIDVVELIKAAGLRYYDKRSQGGLLWLLGSMERLEFGTSADVRASCLSTGTVAAGRPSHNMPGGMRKTVWATIGFLNDEGLKKSLSSHVSENQQINT